MSTNGSSGIDSVSITGKKTIRDHWVLFVGEGASLTVLGVLAIAIPSISNVNVIALLGCIFLVSGAVGLLTTYVARRSSGFWWSLISALLAISVGVVVLANKSYDLYGGLMGWPFENVGPMRMIFVLFFLVEGGASIMFAFEHRETVSGRWAWMLASGVVDIVLASVIIFDLPGASAWTMGLLVGVNMILGGVALVGMGMRARA